jgi:hypothetical protein
MDHFEVKSHGRIFGKLMFRFHMHEYSVRRVCSLILNVWRIGTLQSNRSHCEDGQTIPSRDKLHCYSVHKWALVNSKFLLRPTVSRPVYLGVRHSTGTRDQYFSFFLFLILGSYEFVEVGRPIWREDWFVVFSFYWATPAQSISRGS